MHNGLKTTLIFAVGLIAGMAIAIPGALLLLRSSAGQDLVRSYIVVRQNWPDVTTLVQQSGGTLTPEQQQVAEQLLTTPLGIKVSTKYVTAEYAVAINGVFGDLQAIATSTNELGPTLIQINNQSLAGDFNGFFDLIVKAKMLVAKQRAISAQFSQDLSALNAANQKTSDAVTRSLTQSFIASAQSAPADFNAYLASLDQLLSGSIPSAGQIADLGAKANAFNDDLTLMGGSFQQILARFGATATSTAH